MLPPFLRRGLFAATFTTLLLASPASAQESAPSVDASEPADYPVPPPNDGAEAPEAGPADGERLPRLKVHAGALGYQSVFFRSASGDGYTLHGPAVAYDYFVGRRWGFAIHGVAYLPAYGRYSGQTDFRGPLWEKYEDRHFGIDATLMMAHRLELGDEWTLFFGAGIHTGAFKINGGAYRLVEVISMGVGASGRLQWNFHPLLTLNVAVNIAFDPFDMIDHDDPAVLTVPLGGAAGIGVRF